MLLKCVFLFTFLPTVPCFRGVPDFRTEQVRGGFTFLVSSLSGSLRKHPVFSAQVSMGETRLSSRKNRMLSQALFLAPRHIFFG